MGSQVVDPRRALRLLAAKHVLGLAKSWDFPPAADLALQEGLYSDALAEVASIRAPILSEVAPVFDRAMRELGERIPDQLEAAWTLTRSCVEEVARSTASPVDVLRFLWNVERHDAVPRGNVVGEALDISQLMGICDSYDCPNENFYGLEHRVIADEGERRALLDRLARQEAIAWLERHRA